MFQKLSRILQDFADDAATTEDLDDLDDPRVAAAALLIEAAGADGSFGAEERTAIRAALGRQFSLTASELDDLMQRAGAAHGEQSQLLRFTRALKDRYSEAERTEIIEMLWEVAYADGALHAYEDNLLRRIGGLLYVSDRDRGEARKRVLKRRQTATGSTRTTATTETTADTRSTGRTTE